MLDRTARPHFLPARLWLATPRLPIIPPAMGVLFSLITALFQSSKDLLSKKVAFSLSGALSALASFLFALPFYLLLLAVLYLLGLEDFALSRAFLWLVLLRSLTDVFAEYAKMAAFAKGDISLVSCFLSLTPCFLLITSPLITGDRPAPAGILAVLLSAAGGLTLIYEPFSGDRLARNQAIALALGGAFCFSLNSCLDRLAVQIASPALSGFGMTLVSALLLSPAVFRKKGAWRLIKAERRALWSRGFFEVGFMVLKLTALRYLQAPYAAAIMQLSLLFSVAGGRVIFKEGHFLRRLTAGAMIAGGAVIIALLELNR